MKYPKFIEAQEHAKKTHDMWNVAAKHYIESESFDEFKVKLAADGINDTMLNFMFKLHYVLHNNSDGETRGLKFLAFLHACVPTLAVGGLLTVFILLFSMSFWWYVLLPIIVFPFAFLVFNVAFDVFNSSVVQAIKDAERQ